MEELSNFFKVHVQMSTFDYLSLFIDYCYGNVGLKRGHTTSKIILKPKKSANGVNKQRKHTHYNKMSVNKTYLGSDKLITSQSMIGIRAISAVLLVQN